MASSKRIALESPVADSIDTPQVTEQDFSVNSSPSSSSEDTSGTYVPVDDDVPLIAAIDDENMDKKNMGLVPQSLEIIVAEPLPQKILLPEDVVFASTKDQEIPSVKNLPSKEEQNPEADKFRLTVEPVIKLTVLAYAFVYITNSNLLIYAICHVHFNYSDSECRNLSSAAATSSKVQGLAADYALYRSILETFPAIILSFFIGPWTDKYGRKLALILPNIGYLLSGVTYLIAANYPKLPPEFLLFSSGLSGAFGGLACFMLGVFSYIADITSVRMRTLRIAICDLALAGAMALGEVISGLIYDKFGFIPIYATQICLLLLSLLYIHFFVKETSQRDVEVTKFQQFRDMFDWQNFAKTITVAFKRRDGNIRAYILSLILAIGIMLLPITGEGAVMLLYVSRKFSWGQTQYSYYSAYAIVICVIGIVILMRVVLRKVKVPDLILGLVAVVGCILKGLFNAFSTAGWLLYLGSTLAFFQPLALPIVRAILSKLVASVEQGKILAFLTSCEVSIPLFANTAYTQIYKATLDHFDGAVFLITASFMIIPTVIFSSIYIDLKRKKLTINDLALQIQHQQPVFRTDTSPITV